MPESHTGTFAYTNFYPWRNPDANSNPVTNGDPASFRKHIRYCHVLHESGPSPSARRDDDSDWYFVGFNLDQRRR